jgi:hypothetical protein
MSKHAPATNGVTLPQEALSGGKLNESLSAADRAPQGAELGQGPKLNDATGSYEPATYAVAGGVIRTDR